MVTQSIFKDIPTFNAWKSIEQIHQGFSYDLKYSITNERGEKYFLRISDALSYDRKKQEHEIIGAMTKLGIPAIQQIDFGRCNHGKNVYMLQTWINGETLETALPTLSEEQQYKLGLEAGKMLRRMHSLKLTAISNWYSVRLEQYRSNYKKYGQYGIRYKYEHQIDEYINKNVHLLKGKQVSFVHGDYHVGNMILSPEKSITMIDFDSFDWKAPIEDFYKLAVFSRQISIPFCKGQVDGYTDSNPTSEFWEMYCLCMAMTSFLSLLWGKIRSEEMYDHRKRLCDILVQDHCCFEDRIPRWYRN